MNLKEETNFLMKKYNIVANKNYGQNFLIDENVIDKIIESADISKKDLIIEIGPGLGSLTSKLLENAGKVICIEIDKKMLDILHDRFFLYDNFELINDDILKVNLKEIIEKNHSSFKNVKIVANLPYYITTPIIMKLLDDRLDIYSITVMVQKEIAERLTDIPGGKNCGAITYAINYFTDPKLIFNVSKTSFVPSPKVDSSVINLRILESPRVFPKDEKLFFKIIKLAFLQKRKTLVNALNTGEFGDKNNLENMLENLNIDKQIRGEKLTLEQYKEITDFLCN